jgi:hypothetical protein
MVEYVSIFFHQFIFNIYDFHASLIFNSQTSDEYIIFSYLYFSYILLNF